jgi:hypothetical protein
MSFGFESGCEVVDEAAPARDQMVRRSGGHPRSNAADVESAMGYDAAGEYEIT